MREKLDVLTCFLFDECGFQGNNDEYYDPRNSYVNKVLERKRGLPITLSVVYIEVARRVGLALEAISFPFHFLISPTDVEDLFLDPFHKGQQLSKIDCKRMLERFSDGTVPFRPCYLQPATARQVVLRVMRNLAEWGRGRLIFLITHRLSTIRHADRIYVVDGGRVAEFGTHEQLLDHAGIYQTLWDVQTGAAVH